MEKVKPGNLNRHSVQFKQQAVALAKGSGQSLRSVAKSLGVGRQTLLYWIKHPPLDRMARAAKLAAADTSDPVALKLQLNEAREQIRVLEMEKDILKKATAFFARENS